MKVEGLKVAPTEPVSFRDIAEEVTLDTETYGVDAMWTGANETQWGVQRKEIMDMVSSVRDGRLGMQLLQAQALDYSFLILEGQPRWSSPDQTLIGVYGAPVAWSDWQLLLSSIQMQTSMMVLHVASLSETVRLVPKLVKWSRKSKHSSLFQRGDAPALWGTRDNLTYQAWLLQGVPGVGAVRAEKIVAELRGSPYTLRVTKERLMEIEGVGPKLADAIIAAVATPKRKRKRNNG